MNKMVKIKDRVAEILKYLRHLFPNAHCELTYTKDYELLIAIVLSAQTTDKRVNQVTPILFDRYKTLEDLANANLEDIEKKLLIHDLIVQKCPNMINRVSSYRINECIRKCFENEFNYIDELYNENLIKNIKDLKEHLNSIAMKNPIKTEDNEINNFIDSKVESGMSVEKIIEMFTSENLILEGMHS